MNDNEALLLSISLLERANARLRQQIASGIGPPDEWLHASYFTACFFGLAVILVAALVGYWQGAHFIFDPVKMVR